MPKDKNTYKDFVVLTVKPDLLKKPYHPRKIYKKCLDESEAISRFIHDQELISRSHDHRFRAIEVSDENEEYQDLLAEWQEEDELKEQGEPEVEEVEVPKKPAKKPAVKKTAAKEE